MADYKDRKIIIGYGVIDSESLRHIIWQDIDREVESTSYIDHDPSPVSEGPDRCR